MTQLQQADFDLDVVGFSAEELGELFCPMPNAGLGDPDAVPEAPDVATTQPGDLWCLGDHRLLCADSSKAEDVDRVLDGAAVHLVQSDPPYNVKVEPEEAMARPLAPTIETPSSPDYLPSPARSTIKRST